MKTDSSKDRLVTLLSQWRDEAVVLEFREGVNSVSGFCVLVTVSDTELRFGFDPSIRPNCDFGIFLDDPIATLTVGSFDNAVENILGKPLDALQPEERSAFSGKLVEQVADVRFSRGARLILGLVRTGLTTAYTSIA
jgi:hypothetical protein